MMGEKLQRKNASSRRENSNNKRKGKKEHLKPQGRLFCGATPASISISPSIKYFPFFFYLLYLRTTYILYSPEEASSRHTNNTLPPPLTMHLLIYCVKMPGNERKWVICRQLFTLAGRNFTTFSSLCFRVSTCTQVPPSPRLR